MTDKEILEKVYQNRLQEYENLKTNGSKEDLFLFQRLCCDSQGNVIRPTHLDLTNTRQYLTRMEELRQSILKSGWYQS